jgi:S-adenosylmethionine hydrolase
VTRVITFLSDYGLADEYVGVVHGVIARLAPDARVIDLGHGVPRHDVGTGARRLARALPFTPAGVHLAVVDPEVGSQRRPVAIRTAEEDRILVGPDNGLLAPATERFGGAIEAVDVSRSPFRLEPVSATFHGRDMFAPVAARLAAGAALGEAGDPVEPASLSALELPTPTRDGQDLIAHVLYVDRFGNVALDVSHEDLAGSGLKLGARLELEHGGERFYAWYARTFADVRAGEVLVYEDAYRVLAVAINRGDAAETLQLDRDVELRIRPAAGA